MALTEVTRHHILDYLRGQSGVRYCGNMGEIEFLGRVFDLSKIPSNDHRCRTFAGDLATHRDQFHDWDDDWIYTDSRFALAAQSDEVFLKFLCQMLHPLTNREGKETVKLLGAFNKYLAADGLQIGRAGEISRKPFYGPVPYGRVRGGGIAKVKKLEMVLNATYLARQVGRIEDSIDKDPELAIGTAKEFIESVCKTILAERGKPVSGAPDIPSLTKLTFNELQLLPDATNDRSKGTEVTKRLLSNLAAVMHGITELRGLYGTGHGKDGKTTPIDPRHARLVAGAATALATFLFETHKATSAGKQT
jgi:hypothetical protein